MFSVRAENPPLTTVSSLLADVFPGVDYVPVDLDALRQKIGEVCAERRLVEGERWINKILQLYQIQKIQHGLMMVGPSGSGKTNAWQVLLAALERFDGVEGVSYVIDPKAMHTIAVKEQYVYDEGRWFLRHAIPLSQSTGGRMTAIPE